MESNIKKVITKKSVKMAKLLRHTESFIDNKGWAPVNKLLTTLEIDQKFLDEIVKNDDKGRYEYNQNHSKIRAVQGHSVEVELDFKQILLEECPLYIYHGTIQDYIPSIKMEGIKSMKRQFVHLSPDFETAIKVAERRKNPFNYVLCIEARKMLEHGFKIMKSKNNVYLAEHVPSNYIKYWAQLLKTV
jgi:putative RNA 2'-phosphotransferase